MRRAGTSSREGTTLAKEETNNKGDKGVKREELLIEHTHACTYTHTHKHPSPPYCVPVGQQLWRALNAACHSH